MTERDDRPGLILASGSRTRREMLQAAGLAFTVVPADVDEAALRDRMRREDGAMTPAEIAAALARAKAEAVSRDHPKALVIGADQVLALGDRILDKARDVAEARRTLTTLRGATHELHSAVALAERGAIAWTFVAMARLAMRAFSDAVIDDYLARAGSAVCTSVGAYQIEGPGIQLFERVEGDHFTILGLPLLPLLAELRSRKVLPT
jgi:septum formation protein